MAFLPRLRRTLRSQDVRSIQRNRRLGAPCYWALRFHDVKGWERRERITHFSHGPVPCDFPRSLIQTGLSLVRNLLARPVSGEGRSPQGIANSTGHQPSSHATGTYFPSSRKFANATSRQKTWQHATISQERLSVKNPCRILVVSPPTPPTLHRPQIMANQRNYITPSHSSHRAAFSHYVALRDL